MSPTAFTPTIGKSTQKMRLRHTEPNGTNGGGNAGVDTWSTRKLNVTDLNEIPGASISSNVITLPAGTYRIDAHFVQTKP